MENATPRFDRRSLEILVHDAGPDHWETRKVLRRLASLHASYGNAELAARYRARVAATLRD